MFQLLTFTEARVTSVTNRVERHGNEEKPAVSLGLELTAANTILDLIDPNIRQALYKAVEAQDALPGVEVSTPVLRCNSFEKHTLPTSYEGWTLAVDDGIDDTKPMVFGGVKADKFSVEAKQGGTIVLRLRTGTSDVDADKLGQLAMHNGGLIWITLTAPAVKPDAIDASSSAKDLPKSAEDLFSAGADDEGPDDEDDDGDGPQDLEDRLVDALASPDGAPGEWPFPRPGQGATQEPPQEVVIETSRPGTRTARGRAKTKAALAAGMAEHEASGA